MRKVTANIKYEIVRETTEAMCTPGALFEALKEDFNPLQEDMYVLAMDVKNKIIKKFLVARGASSSLIITPAGIFRPVLLTGAVKFVVAHNHPSGEKKPSEEDICFTNKLKKEAKIMGMTFLDHLIFTESEYFSFCREDLI